MFTVGGQCEGYGGIFEALRTMLLVEHAWLAEIAPDACAVLTRRYPDAGNLGDITAVDWPAVERPDILTSGFPCQPVSEVGRHQGGSDPRFLWPTGVVPALAALRPGLVIVENVRGLITHKGGTIFGRILADLDRLGYAASWATIGACMVGACHHRHRVFLVATPLAVLRAPVLDLIARRGRGGWESIQGVLFGAPDGAPKWPAAGLVAGGQVWSAPVETCGAKTLQLLPTPRASDTGRVGQRAGAGFRPLLSQALHPSAISGPPPFGKFTAAVQRHKVAYGLPAPPPTIVGRNGQPRLSPAFAEFMQGLTPGWLADVVDHGAALRLAGNGANPRQCAYALSVSPTFQSWAQQNAPVMVHGGV